MQHKAAFSSAKHDWETPQAFFDQWNERYQFELDAAASPKNAKVGNYFTEEDDALTQHWKGTVWCNPPYGRQIGQWVKKAYEESQRGAVVVLLIPARTETRWWHEYVTKAIEIHFVKGRIQFGNSGGNAPFPSCVVVFAKWGTSEPRVFWGIQP